MSRRASAPSSRRHARSSRNGLISASFGRHPLLLRLTHVRPGRRPAVAARPRPHRSDLLPVPRPAALRAHRTPETHRHEGSRYRRHRLYPELRVGPRQIRRTDPRRLRRPHPPRTAPRRPARATFAKLTHGSSRSSTCSPSLPPPTHRQLSRGPWGVCQVSDVRNVSWKQSHTGLPALRFAELGRV